MEEKEENQVTIEDIDLYIMELVIDFCYTREISLDDNNYPDFLSAASRFLIKSSLDVIENYLSTILNPSNCSHILELSDQHNLPESTSSVVKFVCRNLGYVLSHLELADMNTNQWAAIWQERSKSEDLEEDSFRKFLKWVKKDRGNRIPIFENMAEYVRFDLFTAPYLLTLTWSALIHESPSCLRLIQLTKDSMLMKLWHRPNRTPITASRRERSWTIDCS